MNRKMLTVNLSQEHIEMLKEIQKKSTGLTRSQIIRRLIELAFTENFSFQIITGK